MKKVFWLALCMMTVVYGCKNKGKAGFPENDNDEAIEASVDGSGDDVPMPMFLITADEHYRKMLYWIEVEEPVKTDDTEEYFDEVFSSWKMQEQFRKHAAEYTNLLAGNKFVKVRYVDEVLKNPDGNPASVGEIHGRPQIPAQCARFELVNPKDADEENIGWIIMTDSYLKSRKRLDIKLSTGEDYPPLPSSVVKKLEKKYGMKALRSTKGGVIGGRYTFGSLQFEGEYKVPLRDENDYQKALALEVLIDGDDVYTVEKLGYYYNGEQGWNADDDGEYIPCNIDAAFEGPKGLELCYSHGAPESFEVGLFVLRDGKYEQQTYETFHTMIDEEIPIWKADIAEMQKLYEKSDPNVPKTEKLTRWAHFYPDYDHEWIWMRCKDDATGAMFLRKDGKITLITTIEPYQKAYEKSANDIDYIIVSGSPIPNTFETEAFGFKEGVLKEHFKSTEVNGAFDNGELNERKLIEGETQYYLDLFKEADEITAWFQDTEEEQ